MAHDSDPHPPVFELEAQLGGQRVGGALVQGAVYRVQGGLLPVGAGALRLKGWGDFQGFYLRGWGGVSLVDQVLPQVRTSLLLPQRQGRKQLR